ncbi:MAG: sporulation protein YqfD [Lachnospiraceae bacterium]|nr:sporulation protein YqfD [Lachnospiraceae bacterium]
MFLSLIKFFRGYLLVRLVGYSPERFLNLCSNHNILIWNLESRENAYEFCISIAGYRRLKPLLKKTKTRLYIKKRIGFPFFMYRYRKRKVFFAGIFLCVGILLYMTTFIWLIDIHGNSSITDDTILTFLEEKKSFFGTKKSIIDCTELEEALRTEFTDIIWASVRINGTKLTIDIQENLISQSNTENTTEIEGSYDITANKDAVITSIITRKGTPYVKEGDVVKTGDILVGSRLDIYNDSNEIAEYVYVTADADIYGQTEYVYEDSFPVKYSEKIKTGKASNVYDMYLFGWHLRIPPVSKKAEPYISYTENRQLSIAKDYYIPITIKKTSYFACDYKQVELTKEQAKEKTAEEVSKFLKKLTQKGIQITDKNVMIEFRDNQCYFRAKITAIEKLGKYVPAEIIELSIDEGLTHESD